MNQLDTYTPTHNNDDSLHFMEQVSEKAIQPPVGVTMKIKTTTYIEIGKNKYFSPNLNPSLEKEQYPIGFYLNFSTCDRLLLQTVQQLIVAQFSGQAYLETLKFEDEYYTYLYFMNANLVKVFLDKIKKEADFYWGSNNEKTTVKELYKQAKTVFAAA